LERDKVSQRINTHVRMVEASMISKQRGMEPERLRC
jgi:hypothetical protein